MSIQRIWRVVIVLVMVGAIWSLTPARAVQAVGTTYYVANSGNDTNTGLSPALAFRTIAKVNELALQPGDSVLFHCGDTWRGEMLVITRSGALGSPITFGSYPDAACANKPVISGAQPVTGWNITPDSSIYVADLNVGANALKFPNGINQLFRNGTRLGIGRWPDINAADGGYSTIDGQPSANQFTDSLLPMGDWVGATAHIKGMRWYILNRTVTGDSGSTLSVGSDLDCWGGNCSGWGYWLDSHYDTLTLDGEWYYNPSENKVYLFSSSGTPKEIEGSAVLSGAGEYLGGIILGKQEQQHIAYVVIGNFEVSKWFDNGITTPLNLEKDENYDIVLRNNTIRDVNRTGINLATWVWNARDNGNGPDGWRGGRRITVTGNLIERANRMGIDSYARQSTFENNVIRDVGRIEYLGQSGMGCATDSFGGGCTEDGDGIRIKIDHADFTGNSNIVQFNRLERIGYNGVDVFGYGNIFYRNVIVEPCYSKGDCGGLRSFGRDSLTATAVHDLTIRENIILNSIGNTDGTEASYRSLFGMGLYIDNFSRNVISHKNIIAGSTIAGILYQNSNGTATDNIVFDNARANSWSGQVVVTGAGAALSSFTGNVLLGKQANTWTLDVDSATNLGTSDQNGYYHSSRVAHIDAAGGKTLVQWRAYSGKDGNSVESVAGELASAELFHNDSKIPILIYLPGPYLDLAGTAVPMEFTLQPFTGRILVPNGSPVANLKIVKSAPAGVEAGGTIEYRLRVTNYGGANAVNLTVRDTVPDGVTYLSGGSLQSGEVVWMLANLAPETSADFTFSVVVEAGTEIVSNSTFSVEADGLSAVAGTAAVTLVDPERVYLPALGK